MNKNRVKTCLREIANIVMGISPSSSSCNLNSEGVPLLNGPSEFGSHHPKAVQFTNNPKKFSKKGDLLFCVRGSTGKMNWSDKEYAIGRGLAAIQSKNGKLFSSFIKGCIEKELQNLLASSTGSVFSSVNKTQLEEIPVYLPSNEEITKIENMLGSLEKKIELNRQNHETLEELSSTLFKSWFIDFDPVKAKSEGHSTGLPNEISDLFPDSFGDFESGKIPSGWKHIDLGTLSKVIDPHPSHRAPKSVKEGFPFAGIGDIDEMGNIKLSKARIVDESSVLQQEKSYKINENSIGFGRVGTVGKVVRLRKQNYRFALSPTLAVINPIKEEFSSICHCLVRSKNFQNKVISEMTGSTRPAIGIQVLRKIKSIFPNIENLLLYKEFEKIISPIIKRCDLINKEIKILEEMRDALLPKLISGKLIIPDAKKMLEEVGI